MFKSGVVMVIFDVSQRRFVVSEAATYDFTMYYYGSKYCLFTALNMQFYLRLKPYVLSCYTFDTVCLTYFQILYPLIF